MVLCVVRHDCLRKFAPLFPPIRSQCLSTHKSGLLDDLLPVKRNSGFVNTISANTYCTMFDVRERFVPVLCRGCSYYNIASNIAYNIASTIATQNQSNYEVTSWRNRCTIDVNSFFAANYRYVRVNYGTKCTMNYLMLICYMKGPAALQGSSIKSKSILKYLKTNIDKSLNSQVHLQYYKQSIVLYITWINERTSHVKNEVPMIAVAYNDKR